MHNVDNYIAATQECITISNLRYGSYRALAGNISMISWILDVLNSSGDDYIELDDFFDENPAFPSAHGSTPTEALAALDIKLGRLYEFESAPIHPRAIPLFKLRANYDEFDGIVEQYDISWQDIAEDLHSAYKIHDNYFYDIAKRETSSSQYRNLNALLIFLSFSFR